MKESNYFRNKQKLGLIYNIMARYYGTEFRNKSKKREFAEKKALFMCIAYKYTDASYLSIAAFLGYSNHTSILKQIRTYTQILSYEKNLKKQYDDIVEELKFHDTFGILAQM